MLGACTRFSGGLRCAYTLTFNGDPCKSGFEIDTREGRIGGGTLTGWAVLNLPKNIYLSPHQ